MKALSIHDLHSAEARAEDLEDFITAHRALLAALDEAESAAKAWRTWTTAGPRIRKLSDLVKGEINDAIRERAEILADIPSEADELRAMYPREM